MLIRKFWVPAALFSVILLLASCTAMRQDTDMKFTSARLAPCPSKPNCVCSDAQDEAHKIEPLRLAAAPETVWSALREQLADRPRTRIVTATEDYIHAEEKSRVFGFVDDIEFQLRLREKMIAVRSAARVGYSDLGVNRKRIEKIRRELQRRGLVQSLNR